MVKFKVTYTTNASEEIEADNYAEEGDWFRFTRWNADGDAEDVVRIRAADVERIDRVD